MARKSIRNYIFTPGAGGAGTVIIPDPYKLADILMITNVTRNTVIYNFGDPSRGGSVAYTNNTNATATSAAGTALSSGTTIFTNLNNGFTTITLTFDTSTHAAGDQLQIFVETDELKVRPYDFGIDAVERMKIAPPQSLIDADFEYGMQPTKWVQFASMNDMPCHFELPGSDLQIGANAFSYATFIGGGTAAASTWLASPAQTNLLLQNQGFDALGQLSACGPRSITNGYYLIIAQGQAGQPNCAAGTTHITHDLPIGPRTGGMFQRTFTVANTAGWSPGDIACVVEMPGEGFFPGSLVTFPAGVGVTGNSVVATVATTAVTAGVTAVAANNTAVSANAIIMVETTQFGVWEAMQVAAGGGTAALTCIRNLWGTNAANATIPVGARIRQLSGNVGAAPAGSFFSNANVEIMRIDSIDSYNKFTVTRSWFNTNASPTFGANSIVFKVNHSANSALAQNSANIEIVRTTTANPVPLTGQVIERGRLGTRPLSAAGPGSLAITLTGAFVAGNTSQQQVVCYVPQHGIGMYSNANIANCYVSTLNFSQAVTVSNIEGVYINQMNDRDYIAYYPKVQLNQLPGYQLNQNDQQGMIRRGGIYSGANVVVANIASNVGSPSLITVNTVYNHGLTPGQAIQVQLGVGAQSTGQFPNVYVGGTGQFVITSTPTDKSFTYVGKPNLVVPAMSTINLGAPLTDSAMYANITIFPTGLVKHRSFDGGNNIGTNTPAHGYEMTRQTKKYFRYQSGKGTMFTSGTQFMPTFQIANIIAAGTSIGSAITITTENEHGLQIGANVSVYGVNSTGYNTFYRVNSVTNNNQFTILATAELATVNPVFTRTKQLATDYQGVSFPRVTITNWTGAKVRTGIFDDGNGMFYEYDGNAFWAVKRSSTNDIAGRAQFSVNSNYVTGDKDCRWRDQLNSGDQIIVKGMTHTVTDIIAQDEMYITPVYRGVFNAQDTRIVRISEERTPQRDFNQDRMDGTGPSGYVMDLKRMQMVGIQYTWYGAGFVDYMMRAIDGKMLIAHRSKGNNVNDEAYMRTGNLPARYQAVNKGARTWLSKAVPPAESTEIQLYDVSEFPTANATYPVTVQIGNEFINYTGVWTANGNLTGITRGTTMSNFVMNETRSLWRGSNAGVAWSPRGMPSNAAWSSQAFNPRSGVFVAVAGYASASDETARSFDGHNWSAGGALPSSSNWYNIAFGQLGGVDTFVAISNASGTISAYSQDDGATWTSLALPTVAQWSGLAYGHDENNVPVFVAVAGLGSASTASAYLKSLGTGWVAGGALSASQMWTSVAFGKTTSNTAVTNTVVSLNEAGRTNYFCAVGAGANMTTGTTVFNYSTNGGVTWRAGAFTTSAGYTDIAFGNNTWIAIAGGLGGTAGTTAQYIHGNPAAATWALSSLPSSSGWRSIAWGEIYSMNNSAVPNVGIAGQWMVVSDTAAGQAYAIMTNPHLLGPGVAPTWNLGAMPLASSWTSVVWGKGMFTATQYTASSPNWQAAVSVHGNVFLTSEMTLASNWRGLAQGDGNVVAVQYGGTGVQVSYTGGRTWNGPLGQTGNTTGALGSSSNWTAVAYSPDIGRNQRGRFVAISNTSGTINNWQDADNLGATWNAGGALPATATWSDITAVNRTFIAVASGSQTSAFSSNGAAGWGGVSLPSSSNWSSVAGGIFPIFQANTGNVWCVAAVSSTTGTIAAYSNVRTSIAGLTSAPDSGNSGLQVVSLWGTATLPASASWSSVGYGYDSVTTTGRFIAIASGSADTAISVDGGMTWTAGGNLPSSSLWIKVAYGSNGVWVAIANNRDTIAAYSRDQGATWVSSAFSTACNWTNVIYQDRHQHFIAISGDATNSSANVALSRPTAGVALHHTANTGVRVVSVTASPDLNHWGSAVIMDGGFTVDRTYTFTYNVTNYNVVGHLGQPQTMFMMRLAPSISNALTGDLGGKELINRAQVLLVGMYVNVGSAAARFLVQGVLNPTNVVSANWRPLNAAPTFLQPSFTQFVANGLAAPVATIRQIEFAANATVGQGGQQLAATGGEQVFSIPVTQTNSGYLDLSAIKEITSMVLPGSGSYPNGNEVLAINIIPITAVGSNVDIQLTFIESQA
jgi:hypothetical protein